MAQKIIFKEKTSRENVQLIKMASRSSYYLRKYYGEKGVPGSKKYKLMSLETDNLEVARDKILKIDIPVEYIPKQKLSNKGVRFCNNRGYTYIPKRPTEIGINAELLFAGRMYDLGYEIYKPHWDLWATDFVVCKDHTFDKVQVKSSSKENYNVHLLTRDGKRYVEFVDYLAFISFAEDKIYYIPTSAIPSDVNTLNPNFMKKHILPQNIYSLK